MRKMLGILDGEGGFVLVTSMLIMVLVVVVGVSATKTSILEVQVSSIDKFHQMSFFGGDSGVYTVPKMIAAYTDKKQIDPEVNVPSENFRELSADLEAEFKGYTDPLEPSEEDDIPHQIEFDIGDVPEGGAGAPDPDSSYASVGVDVSSLESEALPGGGVEFGSGAEGANQVGEQLLWHVNSTGEGPRNTTVNIQAIYRRIPDTFGGL